MSKWEAEVKRITPECEEILTEKYFDNFNDARDVICCELRQAMTMMRDAARIAKTQRIYTYFAMQLHDCETGTMALDGWTFSIKEVE